MLRLRIRILGVLASGFVLTGCLNVVPSSSAETPSWADEALADSINSDPPANVPLILLTREENQEMDRNTDDLIDEGASVRERTRSIIDNSPADDTVEYADTQRDRGTPPADPDDG